MLAISATPSQGSSSKIAKLVAHLDVGGGNPFHRRSASVPKTGLESGSAAASGDTLDPHSTEAQSIRASSYRLAAIGRPASTFYHARRDGLGIRVFSHPVHPDCFGVGQLVRLSTNLPLCVATLHHAELPVAEVTDSRYTSGKVPSQRLADHGVHLFRRVPGGAL